ncbi:antitoxin [Planomonospora sphaerica]|uniref:antitoxin n=1 Tax=Planomonospora sphaerica TaxID=161355 RepID=UPI00129029E1|nr:antitoxin [Planomonospora sphaerica]
MTTSITLSPQDDFFIKEYSFLNKSASRSAAIRDAIALLRKKCLDLEYAAAHGGGEAGEAARSWDSRAEDKPV